MKFLIAVAVASLCMTTAQALAAGKKENAMHHIASATAAAEVCSSVETNPAFVALAATMYGIDLGGSDGDMITADENSQIAGLRDLKEDSVCQAALFMYGPNGKYVKNLIRSK